jgi:deazaflavin-dependent oxidoreductase (nitroreductase family)
MTTLTSETEERYRQLFKRFNSFMLMLWRLGFRRWVNFWPSVSGRILVLTHTGRKSGIRRQTPVNYFRQGDDVYCTAGFGQVSDWYRNLLAYPQTEVWLPDSWWRGVVEEASHDPQRLPLLRQVIIASGIVGPMMGVDARKMSDEQFAAATADYRLLRIHLEERRSGPGDLAWVWLFPAAALLVWLGWSLAK